MISENVCIIAVGNIPFLMILQCTDHSNYSQKKNTFCYFLHCIYMYALMCMCEGYVSDLIVHVVIATFFNNN